MVRILVTGSHGMLGRAVFHALPPDDPDDDDQLNCTMGSAQLDITDAANVRYWMQTIGPDVVINCAGLTKHHVPEPTDVEYRRVNSLGPLLLAAACDAIGARLIHVSTDCVFSGDRPIEDGPYTEADKPDATDSYGESKAFGEVTAAPHLTVRCSFVGNGDRGLIADLRERSKRNNRWGEQVELWTRAYWSGSTAPAIARALVELAQRPGVTGLMHLTRGEQTTKARLIEDLMGTKVIPGLYVQNVGQPYINRWLASTRDDVPALPPLDVALRELAGG